MNNSPEGLTKRWSAIHRGAGEAIRWIGDVRRDAPSLDSEADDLILSLHRDRNMARRLGAASALPATVGFFGLSQAGKSYLISTLAAGENGKLETCLDGQRLDFLTHINPPGGGKEATGLVTRFSRTARPGPDGFPLELKLFSEIELVKVLANSFFNDFDREKTQYRFKDDKIKQLLGDLGKNRSPKPVSGVGEDDMVALWDYLKGSFTASLGGLDTYYWPKAVELAPWLAVEDRARLFSIFWGEVPELSKIYQSFARILASLGHVDRVFAPLDVLVRPDDKGDLSQADSIMNVDMLERLDKDGDQRTGVRPVVDGKPRDPVRLSLAQLAALTAELVFPLSESPRDSLFEEVDLLDFPGYRGRLKVKSLDDVRRAMSREDVSPVAQLILRGKVAYLFERYTDNQEMNVLIVCTPSNKQSDVADVGPVLERWINATQGDAPEERAKREAGLLWAITMFDMRIGSNLNMDENMLRQSWGNGGMMKMSMLERFGQYSWLQEWSPDQPFNNTFLVRKPRMEVTFLDLDGGNHEKAISDSKRQPLALMRQTFCEDETVRRHIAEPKAAWDAMLALNDGGMERIGNYLRGAARREVKLQRIDEQLKKVLHRLDNSFDRWFQAEGADEVEKKRRIANQISNAIWPRRVLLGELLQSMQLPEEKLRALYLHPSDDPPEAAEAPIASSGALNLGDSLDADGGFDLFGDAPSAAASSAAPQLRGSDARFARAVLSEWKAHLAHMPENTRLMSFFGFDKKAIEYLVGELKTAVDRLKLEDSLSQAITSTEQTGTKREQLAGRQVLVANAVLGDFIGWLGFARKPLEQRPPSRVAPGVRLFQPAPAILGGGLPQLSENPLDYSDYIKDWLVGLATLAVDNAGHSAGREITPQQNEALGRVLDILHEARADQS
jgi:hypothetical protein